MSLRVYTARIGIKDPDAILITRRRNKNLFGKTFAPSDALLSWGLAHRRAGTDTDGVWAQYRERYTEEMRHSYKAWPLAWRTLLGLERVVLMCFCVDGARCHRRVLADILVKLGAVDCGELVGSTVKV